LFFATKVKIPFARSFVLHCKDGSKHSQYLIVEKEKMLKQQRVKLFQLHL